MIGGPYEKKRVPTRMIGGPYENRVWFDTSASESALNPTVPRKMIQKKITLTPRILIKIYIVNHPTYRHGVQRNTNTTRSPNTFKSAEYREA